LKHLLLLLCCASTMIAQVRIVRTDVLPLGTAHEWHAPEFSPDGRSLLVTTSTYDGIWKYDLASKAMVQLTDEPRSGYGFAMSPDGAQIAYRRTRSSPAGKRQELVVRSVESGVSRVVASGKEISLPSFRGGSLAYVMENRLQVDDGGSAGGSVGGTGAGTVTGSASGAAASSVVILGIDNTKIALLRNGQKILLDPLGKGSYIWPTLSPDGKSLAAVEMSRGAFVCDPLGRNAVKLGRANAPSWMRSGGWLVYMDDRDDGHRMISSDLYAVDRGGKQRVRLTATPERLEMFPRCSPMENRVVCSTPEGTVLMFVYEEGSR
jgi:Tol biopolymer transport system component